MEKQMNIPILRFPKFEGVWVRKRIGDIGSIVTGSTPPTSNDEYYNGVFQFVSPIDINEKRFVEQTKTTLTKLGFDKGRKIRIGSSLFVCIGSTIGKVAQNKVECITNQQINAVIPNENFSDEFVYSLLEYHSLKIKMLAGEQAVPIINKTTFSNYSLKLPSLPEQNKISSFLLAIDERLIQLKKKKSLLEQYKKGVKQQIFSQELRFKNDDGNDFYDWKEVKLGEIGEAYSGLTGKSKEDFGSGKPYIQYKQIFDDSRIDISRFDFVEIGRYENQNVVKFGDAFFTVSSETSNEVGMASVLLDEVENLYLNSFCFGYRANKEILNPYFSRYLFHSEFFRKDVVLLAQGSTRFNISKIQFMKIVVILPSIPEQQKIASFLSALDDKIAQTTLQIEKMQLWKKGLLQQMFV